MVLHQLLSQREGTIGGHLWAAGKAANQQKGAAAWTKGREEAQRVFLFGGKQSGGETTALMKHTGAGVLTNASSVPHLKNTKFIAINQQSMIDSNYN